MKRSKQPNQQKKFPKTKGTNRSSERTLVKNQEECRKKIMKVASNLKKKLRIDSIEPEKEEVKEEVPNMS